MVSARIIRNRWFRVVLDEKRGVLSGIFRPGDRSGNNYLVSPEEHAGLDLPRSAWFGTVQIRYRTTAGKGWDSANTGLSTDAMRIGCPRGNRRLDLSFKPQSSCPGGIRHFLVKTSFRLHANKPWLEWTTILENPNDHDIEIGEVSFPIAFNSWVRGLSSDEMYTGRFIVHPFIAGHSSYVLVQRLDGNGPCLLMVPDENTPLECLAQPDAAKFKEMKPAGGGVKRLYVHSKASREALGWKEWFHGHTSTVLKRRGRLKYGFKLLWASSYDEVGELLYELGKVVFRVVPGMVLPEGTRARILLRSKKKISTVSAPRAVVKRCGRGIYELRCRGRGLRRLEVFYGKGQWSALVFNSISPIDEQIKSRAKFIASKQQVTARASDNYGAFLMWDADEKKVVTEAPAPYFYGGSDELGFADPLFLAAKNVRCPEKKQIAALERYIDNFLFGKLQDKKDYGVVLWYGDEVWRHYRGSDRVRSFNYPHVFNIYFSMYLIATLHGLTKSRGPLEYLRMAYRTARAMYDLKMIAGDAYTVGNMGASMLLKIVRALEEEGMAEERRELLERMRKSARYFVEKEHPYGSEFSYDTTGFETVYFFRKYVGGDIEKTARTLAALLALRHRQPMWCQSGNDVRCGMGNGKSGHRRTDEICFSYMAPLNGWCVLDAFKNTRDPRLLETGYAGVAGCWSLVEPDGTGHNLYTHEPDGMLYDAWTSEMGLALFASIESMASYVIDDPDFGTIGYGCSVGLKAGSILIIPHGGFDRKIVDAINEVSVTAQNGIITKMKTGRDRKAVVEVAPVLRGQREIIIEACGLNGRPLKIVPTREMRLTSGPSAGTATVKLPKGACRTSLEIC